jgi:hypothetical protein
MMIRKKWCENGTKNVQKWYKNGPKEKNHQNTSVLQGTATMLTRKKWRLNMSVSERMVRQTAN